MFISLWLKGMVAMLLSIFQLSHLLIPRSVEDGSDERCATPDEEVACEDDLDEELVAITSMMADVQMRQMWGKDIDHIN